jgi:hypothetical protein
VYAARGFLQKLITDLAVRARELRLPDVRPGLTELRGALTELRGAVRGPLDRVANAAPVRQSLTAAGVALTAAGVAVHRPIEGLHALRSRLRSTRLGRSADGLIVIPLLGLALVLGVFAATAATKSSSPTGEVRVTPAANASDRGEGEVVTETIRRKGKTVRVVRYEQKPGRVVTVSGRSVTLPVTLPGSSATSTVHDTRTHVVTVTNSVTTTEQVVVISTETEYITTTVEEDSEPPPDPDHP